jgi:hypothetical protein
MSEVTVYLASDLHPSEHVVLQPDYESVVFDLAALREDLAKSQELSVTNILMDVVPGLDGMGDEIYAKSAAEVQLLISNLYLKTEELEESLTAAELAYDAVIEKIKELNS